VRFGPGQLQVPWDHLGEKKTALSFQHVLKTCEFPTILYFFDWGYEDAQQ
jgi:hypothetical protein